ncbi:protein Mis18-alpha-like [Hippocampus comes]|uniref:protein Mis18-alpha-like n=1 Tax=Hippocampus comes TaxID=109280 RepID=UPI00094F39BD|nr:PREDICTED: protein Mis18-alpha-like [Hippocampus comes]
MKRLARAANPKWKIKGGELSRFAVAEIQTERKMATRAKDPTDGVGSVNRTFETFSVDSSVDEDTGTENDVDRPVVFICAKCKLPVGDSMSWDSNQDGQTQIQLKRVTNNVLVGKDTRQHEVSKGSFCCGYVLGSASQKLSAEGPKEQPVTLEYRGQVERVLTEVRTKGGGGL